MPAKTETVEKESVLREAYSKRMKLLIHGLGEKEGSEWETREETEGIYDKFLSNALDLLPEKFPLIDIHRLPQHPVTKNGANITRPIIIKPANVMDIKIIMNSLKK